MDDFAKQLAVRTAILADAAFAGVAVFVDDGRGVSRAGVDDEVLCYTRQDGSIASHVEAALMAGGVVMIVMPFGVMTRDKTDFRNAICTIQAGRIALMEIPAINDAEGGAGKPVDVLTRSLLKLVLRERDLEPPEGEIVEFPEEDSDLLVTYFNFDYRDTVRA